jgi:hypothetical protein
MSGWGAPRRCSTRSWRPWLPGSFRCTDAAACQLCSTRAHRVTSCCVPLNQACLLPAAQRCFCLSAPCPFLSRPLCLQAALLGCGQRPTRHRRLAPVGAPGSGGEQRGGGGPCASERAAAVCAARRPPGRPGLPGQPVAAAPHRAGHGGRRHAARSRGVWGAPMPPDVCFLADSLRAGLGRRLTATALTPLPQVLSHLHVSRPSS